MTSGRPLGRTGSTGTGGSPLFPHPPPPDGPPIVVVFEGPVTPDATAGFCARVRDVVADGAGEVVCDVAEVDDPDVALIDAFARLQLLALRQGCRVRMRRPPDDLRALLDLMGLCEVVLESPVQVVGQPEEAEQPGVEEVGDAGDAIA